MSSLSGKLVSQVEIKSNADVFHDLFRNQPHQLPQISPQNVKKTGLHDGDWGSVGSVVSAHYVHDGKECFSKDIIEAIDEEKKLVKFKIIEGDLLESYKNISVTVHVETHGESNLVTWTIEFEKLHQGIPDPNSFMDFCIQLTKDIESHHLTSNESPGQMTQKLVSSIEIKSDGDVFHEIFRERPHDISNMSPAYIQGVDLHDGDWGKVGSVIFWNYTHDGKAKVAKEVIEAIDEAKKSVTFRVIEGDLLELYKSFVITVHVDTVGENNLVTWTFEYEKQNDSVPDPNTLMDFCLQVTKDIETHHLSNESSGKMTQKLVSSIEIKSDGDVFHEIFRERPHDISKMSPAYIQGVDLHDGDWGKVGSVIFWNYTHDGKEKVAKEIIEAIDEQKKSVRFRVIEGDLMELYKSFVLTVHVDTVGESNLVTWTLEYEKQNDSVPDPQSLMDFCLQVTKDIETHHLK